MLRRTSLRVTLVAAVLGLVTLALVVISAGSALALRSYLLDRVDEQLLAVSREIARPATGWPAWQQRIGLPTDYYVRVTTVEGVGDEPGYDFAHLTEHDLPPLVTGSAQLRAREGRPYTVRATDSPMRWRMLVTVLPNGSVLHLGRNLSDVDSAVARLVWIDVLVGSAVLVSLAALGAAVVRSSLRPLVQIERTAGAIAAGDLSRRVPDPEPEQPVPRTELGRLARALNAMLAQIEMAFTARAASESAARAAEAAARDAAAAAQVSEGRARRSEERMRQFVADASHELRTPLTTIRGFAELYRQGVAATPDEQARLVRRIEDEAARMGLLVEDLLLLARLDRERPVQLAPVELTVLAVDAVQAARVLAPGRRIALDLPRAAPPGAATPEAGAAGPALTVLGDDARLRQVIGNLMTNALTHTPADAEVTLRLRAAEDRHAVIEVADTGPGLSPEQAERVFERFYRADAARTRGTGTGTGLGLAIVAAIVAAHRGTVHVRSRPGEGAAFTVRLPLAPPAPPAAPAPGGDDAAAPVTVNSQARHSPAAEPSGKVEA